MSSATTVPQIIYPDSDGMPMAENSLQAQWIVTIHGGLASRMADRPDVLVLMDNLWYPVEYRADIRIAPDIYVVFGRPKGRRGSYKQWVENNIPLTVVFEVLSPGNRLSEMNFKFDFYQYYGVDEYYIYDPDDGTLECWIRNGERFEQAPEPNGFVSPRLGIRFDLSGDELVIYGPEGERFQTFEELFAQNNAEKQHALEEKLARQQAQQRADRAQATAEMERQRAETERLRAKAERLRADKLAAKLRELGIDE